MKKLRVLNNVIKRTSADRILWGYVIFFLLIALIIMLVEPNINNFGDSVWYCYSMAVTIGFGDFTAVTIIGRVLSIILSLYSLLLIGMIPAIIVNYYMAIVKVKEQAVFENFLDKLESLPTLSHEELVDLSKKIKAVKLK